MEGAHAVHAHAQHSRVVPLTGCATHMHASTCTRVCWPQCADLVRLCITGTERVREGSDEAVHDHVPGKRQCRFSSEMLHVVRSDQVGPAVHEQPL